MCVRVSVRVSLHAKDPEGKIIVNSKYILDSENRVCMEERMATAAGALVAETMVAGKRKRKKSGATSVAGNAGLR